MKTPTFYLMATNLLLAFCISFSISAQEASAEEEKDMNPTLFQSLYAHSDFTPTMKIHTSVKELFKNKSVQEEYYIPGSMSLTQAEGDDIEFGMKVKIRGNTRKKVCDNAPIKLNFEEAKLKELGLNADVDKLKLVLQCENSGRSFQQLLKEKLIYDLYESIDSNYMMVKLIKLEMYEEGKLKEDLNAFIVEDEEAYAFRKNGKVLERGKINYSVLPRDEYFKLCFFQYMIANCDWSIANKHNIELVKLADNKSLVSVPYDFDYAGFINNSYAVPPEHFPITNVTERYFMIRTQMTKEEVDSVLDFYEGKKDEFYQIIEDQKFLDEKNKKSAKSFIERFYKSVEKRDRVLKAVKPRTK